jgi:hypothetical protein
VEQQGQLEPGGSFEVTTPGRPRRVGGRSSRRAATGGPAFINDQAEEQHHLDVLRDPRSDHATRVAARIELARLYERRGAFAEAVEQYERNVWDGVRTPATYAGLAGAYRELGRDDLAEAALDQVRRQGGAERTDGAGPAGAAAGPRAVQTRAGAVGGRRARSARWSAARNGGESMGRAAPQAEQQSADGDASGAAHAFGQLQRSVAPFLAGQAGRRTLIASTVLLPIAVGLGIFAIIVFNSARPRSADQASAARPAPVATVATTSAPAPPGSGQAAVPAALTQPPAPPRLVVSNVGQDGLSLRRSPGTGDRVKVWPEKTELADLGEAAEHSGKSWRKVRDPDGNVGWVAAEFLADPATGAATGASSGAPAAPSFASGGLGLTRAEWEQAHGQPRQASIFLEYGGGRLVVGLLENKVWHIERVWMRGDAVALDTARDEVRAYLPSDAAQVQSVDRGDGRIIDVYTSALLAPRFGSTAWNGGKAGTFSIQYRFRSAADRIVTSAMFRLGDALY